MSEDAKNLREMKQRIAEACGAELQAVLTKHGCTLKALPSINADGRIETRIEIAVKE